MQFSLAEKVFICGKLKNLLFCISGDAIPPQDVSSWFLCHGSGRTLDPSVQNIPHDIYAIGTQETGLPEKDWIHKTIDTVEDITGKKYHQVEL